MSFSPNIKREPVKEELLEFFIYNQFNVFHWHAIVQVILFAYSKKYVLLFFEFRIVRLYKYALQRLTERRKHLVNNLFRWYKLAISYKKKSLNTCFPILSYVGRPYMMLTYYVQWQYWEISYTWCKIFLKSLLLQFLHKQISMPS